MTLSSLIAQAEESVAQALPDSTPRDGLEALYSSYTQKKQKDEITQIAFEGNLVRSLQNVIATEALSLVSARPSALPTMVILGLPRSGSTLLHSLLALEEGTGFISHVDAVHSWWRLTGEDFRSALAEAVGRLDLIDALNGGIRDSHPMQADWPEECTMILENSCASYQWSISYGLPQYFDWLTQADLSEHYTIYGRAVDVLAAGVSIDRRVLKSPFHVLEFDKLRSLLASPSIVLTVRRSRDIVPSWLTLTDHAHKALSGGARLPPGMAQRWLVLLARMAEESVKISGEARCQVVSYNELVAKPLQTVEALLAQHGRTVSDAYRRRMRAWLRHPESLRRSEYSEVYGPTPEELAKFDHYDAFFSVA